MVVDSERLVEQAEMVMIAALRWPITREEILTQHLGRSEAEVTANIERHIGRELPHSFRAERDAAYASAFREQLVEVPGVHAAVEVLLASGWQVCIASSGSPPG